MVALALPSPGRVPLFPIFLGGAAPQSSSFRVLLLQTLLLMGCAAWRPSGVAVSLAVLGRGAAVPP